MMRSVILALGVWLCAGPALAASDITRFQLDNGLDVVVQQDERAPVAMVLLLYRVGSKDEPPGITGISHMLEHMLFKNTKHLEPGDYSRLVSRFGGVSNAFTSRDYTGYFQRYEASRLPLALELEAERMVNLRMEEEEFERELQVVLEERSQRTDDNPAALAWERFASIAQPGTGYSRPIIGWRREIEQYRPEQAMDWYERWYAPGNASLVIVGDVAPEETRALVERFYGDIPARNVPTRPEQRMLPPPGERRVTLHKPLQVPLLYMGYNVPSISTADDERDYYVLTMLGGILDGGRSARVQRNLIRGDSVATSAGAHYQGRQRGDGLFVFSGAPSPGTSLEELEEAFLGELERLREEPPEQAELDRVRAQVLSSNVFRQDSISGRAMELGRLTMLDLPLDHSERMAEALEKVTPEDIQKAVERWFTDERRAVAHVHPRDEQEESAR